MPNNIKNKEVWDDIDYNKKIQVLKDLVIELDETIDKIDSALNTKFLESLNHSRTFQADKNFAWWSSWKTRA